MEEEWKRLIYRGEDLGDFYLVSNFGEIKGVKTGRIRKNFIFNTGYYGTNISTNGIKKTITVHRAVIESFIENKEEKLIVNHKDGNKLNNNLDNLEYCTYSENTKHAVNTGLLKPSNAKAVMCINNGIIFNCIMDANEWIGRKRANSTLGESLQRNGNNAFSGRDKITGEKLYWTYI